ncbi:facilitated trehalose transporter Tret1-like [Epargyreus clarus]|uniref:facilitated trehalose transporter Tret1-like n=1 Tax=Epargyreus clarus TaxID=520877 RepID=UPI003C2FDB5A
MWCGDVYFWRQSLVMFGAGAHGMATGFLLSFPSVLNPAITAPNTTDIKVTSDEASWITSSYGLTGFVGFLIVPSLMQKYGRKTAHIFINIFMGAGFVMLALAKNAATLYAARCIQGVSMCAIYVLSIIIAEYSNPKRRGYFISLKNSFLAFGSLVCHSLALLCTWRQIAAIAVFINVIAILLTLTWPESPGFCAMKGKYEDCDKAFIYLNGDTPKTRKVLEELITAQKESRENKEMRTKKTLSQICKRFLRKDFLKPFAMVTLLTIIIDSAGRYYNLAYIVQIVKDITGDNSVAIYCSIGVDFLSMVAFWISTYFITKFSRRALVLSCGYFSVLLMFLISLTVYLKSIYIHASLAFIWLILTMILLHSFIVNAGVIPVCFTVSGEIFPLELKGSGTTATGIVFTLLYALTMKCTPIMMEETGIEGTYGIYGLCLGICLVILHFIMTETKDKTLQEIEDEIKGIQRTKTTILQELDTYREY